MVDEAGAIAGGGIQLFPPRRTSLGKLELAVAAPQQPGARRETGPDSPEAALQLGDAAAAGEVGAVRGKRVIDDVRVRIAEKTMPTGWSRPTKATMMAAKP